MPNSPPIPIFVTARLKSSRLPRKVLLEVQGKPLIEHLIDRLKLANRPDSIVLCTSTHPEDQALVTLAARLDIPCFAGHEDDVLDRYLRAADWIGAEFFVVTWGDEVFCDPFYVDRTIDLWRHLGGAPDLIVSDELPVGTYTYGVSVSALRRIVARKKNAQTEVWGRYFQEERIRRLNVAPRHRRTDVRLTCDYAEDFVLVEKIIDHFSGRGNTMTLDEILVFLDGDPSLKAINWFRNRDYQQRIVEQAKTE